MSRKKYKDKISALEICDTILINITKNFKTHNDFLVALKKDKELKQLLDIRFNINNLKNKFQILWKISR